MKAEEIVATFDQQAASYDEQAEKTAPIRDGLYLLLGAVLSDLSADARILCVGAGTGAELIYLAQRFPQHRFTAVEPSGAMLEVCRRRAEEHGIESRCVFHEGYLDSLPSSEGFDAATSLLVSQFIMEREARSSFFRGIAERLRPGGYLINADLASDGRSAYESLLEVWLRMMAAADVAPEKLEALRAAYGRDVAILPPDQVGSIMASGGFDEAIQFFQGGLVHAWYARRALDIPEQ